MRFVELTQGKQAIVDDEDYERVAQYKWHAHFKNHKYWVAVGWVEGKKIALHKLLLDTPKGFDTDHINHSCLDNRRANIRVCTRSQNNQNQNPQSKEKTSRYKGVYRSRKYTKWQAYIKICGVRYSLGHYNQEYDAALAYNLAAMVFFGEFAYLNDVNTFKGRC